MISPVSASPRIAISLGASFLGYATHAGFLARLHELGVRPAAVGGSSAGALAAGLYASGLPVDEIRALVVSWRLRWAFVQKTPWWTHYLKGTFNNAHFSAFDPAGAVDYLESIIGRRNIEDLGGPAFMAAVCDLAECQSHFLTKGSLAAAMVASCCVPSVFGPIQHQGMHCYDGGVAHETPVDPWIEDPEVDLIVVHRVAHTPRAAAKFFPFNLFNLMGQAHACACEQLLQYRLRLAVLHQKRIFVTQTLHDRPGMFPGRQMESYYAAGEAEAQRFFEEELQPLLVTHEPAAQVSEGYSAANSRSTFSSSV